MTTFTVEIIDESHLAGIAAARSAYNAALAETIKDEEGNDIPNPDLIGSDAEYVQFVMSKAAESYSRQYGA